MPSAIAPERIPAWKRLGLKLKSTQTPEHTSESPVQTQPAKRKSTDVIEQTPSKKVKKSSNNPLISASNEDPPTPSLARKKSVTFTPETKVEDGDSIKQLFNAWVVEQKSQDPSFQPKSRQVFNTPQPPKVDEQVDTSLDEKERRLKRVKKWEDKADHSKNTAKQKKPKSPKPSKITKAIEAPLPPFLVYLKQYHESRATWKFNKNHQNHLLKNVFDVKVIPSDHAHLIYEYVRGLQGGVRTRLRDTALAIKVKDQEDNTSSTAEAMSDPDKMDRNNDESEKRQREYNFAINEYVATMNARDSSSEMGYEEGILMGLSDKSMASRVAKRVRAEQIVAELGILENGKGESSRISEPEGVNGDNDSQKRLRMGYGSSQKVVRKRKQRTAIRDDESSSSNEPTDLKISFDDDSTTPPRR